MEKNHLILADLKEQPCKTIPVFLFLSNWEFLNFFSEIARSLLKIP